MELSEEQIESVLDDESSVHQMLQSKFSMTPRDAIKSVMELKINLKSVYEDR